MGKDTCPQVDDLSSETEILVVKGCNQLLQAILAFLFFLSFFLSFFGFLRQGFFVALDSLLTLALVDQAVLELTDIHRLLPPECWN